MDEHVHRPGDLELVGSSYGWEGTEPQPFTHVGAQVQLGPANEAEPVVLVSLSGWKPYLGQSLSPFLRIRSAYHRELSAAEVAGLIGDPGLGLS